MGLDRTQVARTARLFLAGACMVTLVSATYAADQAPAATRKPPADAPPPPPRFKAPPPLTAEQQAQRTAQQAAGQQKIATARAKPTPRTADGRIDLTGLWGPPAGQGWTSTVKDGSVIFNFPEYGGGGKAPLPANGPKYKPDLVKKVDYNDEHSSFVDKTFLCGLPGVPRLGAPQQIIQGKSEVALLYVDIAGEVFRAIPADGRGFREDADATYNGDSIGRWDGDTFVIDSVNFVDETWLGGRGYFHSDRMKVHETLKREGDVLTWTATVTDPVVLIEPWTTSRVSILTDVRLDEPPPCSDIVRDHLVNNDNHS